jgi:hypothetical protein
MLIVTLNFGVSSEEILRYFVGFLPQGVDLVGRVGASTQVSESRRRQQPFHSVEDLISGLFWPGYFGFCTAGCLGVSVERV